MIKNRLHIVSGMIRYNLKVIFANKFVYFLIAAMAFYLMVTGIMLFADNNPVEEDIYNSLIFPALLIVFYPVIFNIQNDKDSRMLEIVFGIPNYRYKVYLLRFFISILLLVVVLFLMTAGLVFAIIQTQVLYMVYQLLYPLLFLASVSFLVATIVKNGNGAAVVMVIIGLFFWIMAEPLEFSKWNIFLNPFNNPTDISQTIWMNILFQNRVMLVVGAVLSILWALINLQRRERFI